MQKWLDVYDVLIYSTYNEGKSVGAERFTRTFNCKIYKEQPMIVNVIFMI